MKGFFSRFRNAGKQERETSVDANLAAPVPAPPDTFLSLPDVPGVPGDIIGIKISHGWASPNGFYEIVEIGDGMVCKSYAVEQSPDADAMLSRLPAPVFVRHEYGPLSPIHVVLQNVRYYAAGRSDDAEAPLPVSDATTSMRVTYRAWSGEIREVAIHADPEYGADAGSKAARSILKSAESVFGNKCVLDGLLVVHRRRRAAVVVMNGNLYASTEANSRPTYAIDGENDELLEIGATMRDGRLCLELRVVDLRSDWKSHKAIVEVKDKAVVRLAPSDFVYEGTGEDAVVQANAVPRPGFPEPAEWLLAFAPTTFLHEQRIDVASVLPGFELLDEPDVYRDPAVQVNEDLSVSGFDHPFPAAAELEELKFDLASRHPGAVREFRSITDHTVHRTTQLDEARLYFLTEYLNEDGTSAGRFSFDIEEAHDSHYSFDDDGAARLRRMIGVAPDVPLAAAMVEYAKAHDAADLASMAWQVRNSSISY